MADLNFKKLKKSNIIDNTASVKVTQMGNIIEVTYIAHIPNSLGNIRKLDKEYYTIIEADRNVEIEKHNYTDSVTGENRTMYVDTISGEVLEKIPYELNENRSQNTAGLKRTFKKLRDLINNNFTGEKNELFITLTYRLNADGTPQNDIEKTSKDFDRFIKRFRRKYPDLEYIAILEPQANTAWHWHILCKFTNWNNKKQIRIDNNAVIEPLWGHGFTSTKAINHIDNIGSYLSAYLGNIEINDENKDTVFDTVYKNGQEIEIIEKEITDKNGVKSTKKFVKGGRVHLYKSGANIYRHSRGIKKPTSQKMSYAEAKKNIIKNRPPVYSHTVIIENKKGTKKYNSITFESYNLKRKKKYH